MNSSARRNSLSLLKGSIFAKAERITLMPRILGDQVLVTVHETPIKTVPHFAPVSLWPGPNFESVGAPREIGLGGDPSPVSELAHDDTEMQLLGARYCLPRIGRFLTQDPIGHEGGLNLYAYCENSPLGRVDPSARDWDRGQYWSDFSGVFQGYGNGVVGLLKSPWSTSEFLGTWAGNDWSMEFGLSAASRMWGSFASGITGERGAQGFGESMFDVLTTAASVGAPYAKGGALSKTAYVTRFDSPAGIAQIKAAGVIKEGAFVQLGRGGPLSYVLTGVPQLGYPYRSKITFLVNRSDLAFPKGPEWFKGFLGQRVARVPLEFRF